MRKTIHRCFLAVGLGLLSLPVVAGADSGSEPPLIVSEAARAVLFQASVRERADDLLAHGRKRPGSVIEALEAVEHDSTLDPVTRDAVVFDYVQRLRDEPPGAVSEEVLGWLERYSPSAHIPHDESLSFLVPLFDVATAAAGLGNQWEYQAARREWQDAGEAIEAESLSVFVEDPNGPRAAGYRAALERLSYAGLERLAGMIDSDPALRKTMLLPTVALARGRIGDAVAWLQQAPSDRAAEMLSVTTRWLAPEDAADMYRAGIRHPDPAVRSLAMARLTTTMTEHRQADRAAWLEELVDLLDDPQLGGSAALQLSRLADPALLSDLKQRHDLDARARERLDMIPALQQTLADSPEEGSGQ